MTWLARLKEKISEAPGGAGEAKGAKGSLATLAAASPPYIPEKNQIQSIVKLSLILTRPVKPYRNTWKNAPLFRNTTVG